MPLFDYKMRRIPPFYKNTKFGIEECLVSKICSNFFFCSYEKCNIKNLEGDYCLDSGNTVIFWSPAEAPKEVP